MAARHNKALLEDIFEVMEVDPDGKKFDKGMLVLFNQRYVPCALPHSLSSPPRRCPSFWFTAPSFPPSFPLVVSRIKARSDLYEMDLILDINVDIYPVAQSERLSICLSSTLNLDGSDMPTGDPGEQTYDTVRG